MKPVRCDDCKFASMKRGKILYCEKLGMWKVSFQTIYCSEFEPRKAKEAEVE
jgi:hypothetical protein